jgi:hypothetical protein
MVSSKYANIVNGTDSSTINTLGYGIPNLCNAYNILLGTSDITNIEYTFAVYPNPTANSFDVRSFDSRISDFSYLLYDLNGKIVYKSQQIFQTGFHCDALNELPSGTYILQITTTTKTYSTKIIKH